MVAFTIKRHKKDRVHLCNHLFFFTFVGIELSFKPLSLYERLLKLANYCKYTQWREKCSGVTLSCFHRKQS